MNGQSSDYLRNAMPIKDRRSRVRHTAKHLYADHEQWSDIVEGMGDVYRRALEEGCCTSGSLRGSQDVSPACEDHVLGDHDRYYAAKYIQQLQNAVDHGGRVGKPSPRKKNSKAEWMYVGDEGVIVFARETGKENTLEVKTAYRPELPREGSPYRTEDFFTESVRKLRDKTSSICGGSSMTMNEHAKTWMNKVVEEYEQLVSQDALGSSDVWRMLVLGSRIEQSPLGTSFDISPPFPDTPFPETTDLLERLDRHLEEEDEPFGPLLDVILNVDDAAGVLWMLGHEERARDLCERAAGLLSLEPEQLLDLTDFATMRLETIEDDGHVRRQIWNAIEASPALQLMPLLHAHGTPRSKVLADSYQHTTRAEVVELESRRRTIPKRAYAQAAASDEDTSFTLSEGLWLQQDGDRMWLEYRSDDRTLYRIVLALTDIDGTTHTEHEVAFEYRGKTVYADLGPRSGPENLLQKLIAQTSLSPEHVHLHIELFP